MSRSRKTIPLQAKLQVLIEAGYRCAVPTCRTILAIDLHHMAEVSKGGGDGADNLLALCPTCHALYHRGEIHQEAIYAWKSMLLAFSNAFDSEALDHMLFLEMNEVGLIPYKQPFYMNEGREYRAIFSGDGVLKLSRLVAAGLVKCSGCPTPDSMLYDLTLTAKGRSLLTAWKSGRKADVERALAVGPPPEGATL